MFDQLLAEGTTADVTGWDFSWLDGRATELIEFLTGPQPHARRCRRPDDEAAAARAAGPGG